MHRTLPRKRPARGIDLIGTFASVAVGFFDCRSGTDHALPEQRGQQ
ncbi:Uncharacterised protein [Escherichia coli]|nr:Uncharacterised protein [Escherichia coli]STI65929.1 Uncharacterised protein [Escherichia coli]